MAASLRLAALDAVDCGGTSCGERFQPAIQARFILSEADGRYAYLLKAEFPAPAPDLFGKL